MVALYIQFLKEQAAAKIFHHPLPSLFNVSSKNNFSKFQRCFTIYIERISCQNKQLILKNFKSLYLKDL